jgi:hypothetical protein
MDVLIRRQCGACRERGRRRTFSGQDARPAGRRRRRMRGGLRSDRGSADPAMTRAGTFSLAVIASRWPESNAMPFPRQAPVLRAGSQAATTASTLRCKATGALRNAASRAWHQSRATMTRRLVILPPARAIALTLSLEPAVVAKMIAFPDIGRRRGGSNSARPCRLGKRWRFEHHLHPPTPASRTFQATLQHVEREGLAAGPEERMHVELEHSSADIGPAAVTAPGHGAELKAVRFDAPAKPERLAQGSDQHENKMRTQRQSQVILKKPVWNLPPHP